MNSRCPTLRPRLLAAIGLLAGLGGCGGMQVGDFAAGKPPMEIQSYFPGHTKAYGIFFDRAGNVKRQFVVDINGKWTGDALLLDEYFVYDDGAKQERHWTFRRAPSGGWIGTAPDVIGHAYGRRSGNAFNMHYTIDLKVKKSTYRVDFDDWLFRESPEVVLNHAVVSKYGITVGQVQLAFIHDPVPK